ncbi:PIG-L deacetylase family protein [Desulfurobacterium crinifex]
MRRILVVSPHPDDETLGAGGSLLKHKDKGDRIFWCNITNLKEEYGFNRNIVEKRNKEIEKVAITYGFEEIFNLELPPTQLTENLLSRLIESLRQILMKIKPEVLYIPFYDDAHSDHRITYNALVPFLKSFRYPFIKKVLMMEIISETDNQFKGNFKPNVFVDISDYLEKKIEIMKIYKTEIGKHPFPRSPENIKALALYRGAQCNCKYAEAFMLLKEVIL